MAREDIVDRGGYTLLYSCYDGSVLQMLKTLYPEHYWKPWLMKQLPMHYWEQEENVREYLTWISEVNTLFLNVFLFS